MSVWPRLRGQGKHQIDYRHIIDQLIRKPGAFARYVYREDLYPTEVYRRAYENVSEARASIGRYLDFYNRASEHPSVYVIEEKRLCWSSCDPVG